MTDRGKIIKGLECCAAMKGEKCRECPYGHECLNVDYLYGIPHLAADALELLKEQEAQIEQLEHDLTVTQNNLNYYVNGND